MADQQLCFSAKRHADQASSSTISNSKKPRTNFASICHNDDHTTALNRVRMNDQLFDVTLVVDDTEIPAHKSVLAAASPYFNAMFSGSHFIEARQDKVALLGVDYQAFQALIGYVYTTRIDLTEDNVQPILVAASYLQFTDVLELCCELLGSQLNASHCWDIRDISYTHGCFELLTQVDSFIRVHFSEIIQHDAFLYLEHDRMIDVLKCDDLIVKSEEQVYLFALAWLRYDLSNRQQYVAELMVNVRFPVMRMDFLMSHVETEPLLRSHSQCMDYISGAIEYQASKGQSMMNPHSSPPRPRLSWQTNVMIVGALTFDIFHPAEDRWSQFNTFPSSNTTVIGLVALNGKAYVFCEIFKSSSWEAQFDVFDSSTGEWSRCRPMNKIRAEVRAFVHNERIYAIGCSYLSSTLHFEVYDTKTDRWTFFATTPFVGDLCGVGVLKDEIYAVGGLNRNVPTRPNVLNSVARYNPAEDKWTRVANLNIGRFAAGFAVLNDVLFVVGGMYDSFETAKSCEKYDADTDTWSPIADMNTARLGASVFAYNGLLYAVGGTGAQQNSIEVYYPEIDTWESLSCDFEISLFPYTVVFNNLTRKEDEHVEQAWKSRFVYESTRPIHFRSDSCGEIPDDYLFQWTCFQGHES